MIKQQAQLAPRHGLAKFWLYSKKLVLLFSALLEGFYLVYRHRLHKTPNNPNNTRYVQYFCRRVCDVFNVEVRVHGEMPREPALWVSNHISWLDIPVLGSGARTFFLSKAEVASWPLIGSLAKAGGTLFIQRGSGDSARIRNQMTEFLKQDIPVLFFPEATTTDGRQIKTIHGRLLGAAIEAGRPVQITLLCYENHDGQLDMVTPFYGDMEFVPHVKSVLEMGKVTAHLVALPAIPSQGHTVDSLKKEVHVKMVQGLAELQQKVLQPQL